MFYAEGVAKPGTLGPDGHTRLAGWREVGALAGATDRPFAAAALGFAALALVAGMGLAIATFAFAFARAPGAGDVAAFAPICAASGAALGADMTHPAAILARHPARTVPEAGPATAFGLWGFASKLSPALVAAVLLPIPQARGFVPGAANAEAARAVPGLLHAGVPLRAEAAGDGHPGRDTGPRGP